MTDVATLPRIDIESVLADTVEAYRDALGLMLPALHEIIEASPDGIVATTPSLATARTLAAANEALSQANLRANNYLSTRRGSRVRRDALLAVVNKSEMTWFDVSLLLGVAIERGTYSYSDVYGGIRP